MPENKKRHYRSFDQTSRKGPPAPKQIPDGYAIVSQRRYDTLSIKDKYWKGKDWEEIGSEKRLKTMERDGVTFIRFIGTALIPFEKTVRYQKVWESWNETTRQDAEHALRALGYDKLALDNGGDDDFIVVDHEREEWGYFENGLQPFTADPKEWPKNKTLSYWHEYPS